VSKIRMAATIILGLLIFAVCNGFSGFASEKLQNESVTSFPTLRILTSFRIKSLDPVKQGFWYSEFGAAELLMKWDRDFTIKPWVLKSLRQIDNLNWQLTLRPEVTFQNGRKLDANALAALMKRQLLLSSAAKANLPGATVRVTGRYTILFTTQKPNPTIPNIFASESIFPIYDAELVNSVGNNYDLLAGKGIFTGPYEIVSLNSHALTLNRYKQYWQGRPPLQGVRVGFVGDMQAKMLAIENGEADIAIYVPSEAKLLYQSRKDIFFVTTPKSREGIRLILNTEISPFNETDVRRAIGFGINRKEIAENVLNGVYHPAVGYYPIGFPFTVKNQSFDPVKANRLLEETGWKRQNDGIRVKGGKRLSFVMLIYPQQPDLVPIAVTLQAQLKKIGFAMKIVSVDSVKEVMESNQIPWNASLAFDGSISGGGTPQLHRYIHSQGDRNYGGINDLELDALIDKLQITFEKQKRIAMLRKIQKIIIEEKGYQFFIVNKLFPAIVTATYKNYLPSHNWVHVSYDTKPGE